MDFQTALRARLIADEAVAAIAAARVYWVERTKGSAYPAITLQVISDPRSSHLKGFDGARSTRVQMDCWATSYGAALQLARAAIAALAGPAAILGKKFGNALVEGQRDLSEPVADGSTIHRQSVDLIIWHVGD
ncbi:hypothetical protein TomMM35A_18600 [Sphingobium sp. TomMM35A]